MESFITTFHIDWKIILAQAINFVIVFIVLYFLALRPLKKLMSERSARISGGIEDAKRSREILADTQKEYDTTLARAKQEAHTIFQEGKQEAEDKKAEMLTQAQLEVEAIIKNGKKSLEAEKVKMIEEAKNQIVSLVVAATEKVLRDRVDDVSITNKSINSIAQI